MTNKKNKEPIPGKLYSIEGTMGFVLGATEEPYSVSLYGRPELEKVDQGELRAVSPNTLQRLRLDPVFRAWAREQRSKHSNLANKMNF